jgi:hypothetical protein
LVIMATVINADGTPWSTEPAAMAARRQVISQQLCAPSRPWREWLEVRTRRGDPWGAPAPHWAVLDRWLRKIAVELAEVSGITVEETTVFVEANRELISGRFANRVARADVVLELKHLSEAARTVLAAE